MEIERQPTTLRLLCFGGLRLSCLKELAVATAAPFGFSGGTVPSLPVPVFARSPMRGQYRAGSFLRALTRERRRQPEALLLGFTGLDLYAPHLSFVYGKADQEAGVAVVSLARLVAAAGAEQFEDKLFRQRLLKEAIHELGHLVGLSHCAGTACVMRYSSDIAITDFKGPGFCSACGVIAGTGRRPADIQANRELYLSSG